MPRKVFYSFHYELDHWRASQVRNIGVVEGNSIVNDNEWEKVKKSGDEGVKNWINNQLNNRSCTIVLIGAETAQREWIKYEIEASWAKGKALLGIYIHGLKGKNGSMSCRGRNPFDDFTIFKNDDGLIQVRKRRPFLDALFDEKTLSSIVTSYDPGGRDSKETYSNISTKLNGLINSAIVARKKY